jgi:hypothetical protein
LTVVDRLISFILSIQRTTDQFQVQGSAPPLATSIQLDSRENFFISVKNSKSQITKLVGSRVQRFRVLGSALKKGLLSINPERGTVNL